MSKATASTRRFLKIAVLTISDSRCFQTDSSGSWLQEAIENDGHELVDRKIVVDDIYQMRAIVSSWIAEDDIEVVITTGGTGFTGRDSTPEALAPIFDKHIEGFGELFQSRCLAGLANRTAIFCLPGSTGACKTGWNGIIKSQLDSTFEPCNFVQHVGSEVK